MNDAKQQRVARLQVLGSEDAEAFRKIRLKALTTDPSAFGSTYARESAEDLDFFRKRCSPSEHGFVVGAFDGSELVGMAGIFRESGERRRHQAVVWTMYVLGSHRGTGLGRKLLDDVVSRARELDGVLQVRLTVNAANTPARELYASYGFQSYGIEKRAQIIDGESHDEESFVLFFDE